jgi:hypothetical protein
MIGLFALGLVALVWTDTEAGCSPGQLCGGWLNGSGYPTGIVTVDVATFGADSNACPAVFTCQGPGCIDPSSGISLHLRLLGNAGKNCGFSPSDETCPIEGVALCGTSTNKKVTIDGPLFVDSNDGFAQTDDSTNSANFRFQLETAEQANLCGTDTFKAFFAREGFYEIRVDNGTTSTFNRQFCTSDLGGITKDDIRVLHCKQL